jgi:hypothetical protein
MASLASYVLAALATVLVTDYFNPILAPGPGRLDAVRAEPASEIATQMVDRSHKGDRLDHLPQATVVARDFAPIEVRLVRVQVFHRRKPLRLPIGCDELASPLAGSPESDLAGRCLT